jgi:ketosteroid isomerase-like protein
MPTYPGKATGLLDPTMEVGDLLTQSAAAWNARDLAGFVACYENSPETTYLTTAQVAIGYTAIHKMYAERFGADNFLGMGVLSMSLLHVAPLGAEYAFACGRYSLNRDTSHGGPTNGVFSLVLRQTPMGWRIVADHTF